MSNAPSGNQPFPIFISYAHLDNDSSDRSKRWLDRLLEHLEPLVGMNQMQAWSDKQIETGDNWDTEIKGALRSAKAAVLLLSPSFLASKYIKNNELPALLMNAKDRGVHIIPVIVRHCLLNETKFKYPDPVDGPEEISLSTFQAANAPNSPLNSMVEHEQDRILLSIAQRLHRIIKNLP